MRRKITASYHGFLLLFISVTLLFLFFKPKITSSNSNSNTHQTRTANELGGIMILMYHNIGLPESTWTRTPKNFEKDLEVLYRKNFRPISIYDYVTNNIDIPKGMSPFVITFDDGTLGQFKVYDNNGTIKPTSDSAVGILENFREKHSDFHSKAVFFLNGKYPFKQAEYVTFKLNYLVSIGMDIGNHTSSHHDLSKPQNAYAEKIQAAIGTQSSFLESIVPQYRIRSLALCFGARPRAKNLQIYLQKGTYKNHIYENLAILNVGSSFAPSPLDKKFNAMSIPRIRASETATMNVGLYDWLKFFQKHPEKLYVSDGDPNLVTYPKLQEANLNFLAIRDKQYLAY